MSKLDNLFRKKLADHEMMPPESVWHKIQYSGVVSHNSKRGHFYLHWEKYAAAILFIIIGSFTWYWLQPALNQNTQPIASVPQHAIESINSDNNDNANQADSIPSDQPMPENLHLPPTSHGSELPKPNPSKENDSIRRQSKSKSPTLLRASYYQTMYAEIQHLPVLEAVIKPLSSEIQLPYLISRPDLISKPAAWTIISPDELQQLAINLEDSESEQPNQNPINTNSKHLSVTKQAKSKLFDLAETAISPIKRWTNISEIEFIY